MILVYSAKISTRIYYLDFEHAMRKYCLPNAVSYPKRAATLHVYRIPVKYHIAICCINTVSQLHNMTVYSTFLFAFQCTGFVGLPPQSLDHFHVTLPVTVLKHPAFDLTNPSQLALHFPIVEGLTNICEGLVL